MSIDEKDERLAPDPQQSGFMLWREDIELWCDMLEDDELGQLFRAVAGYMLTNEEPQSLPRRLNALFKPAKGKIDRDKARYTVIIEQRRKAGRASAKKKLAKLDKKEDDKLDINSTGVNERLTSVNQLYLPSPSPSPSPISSSSVSSYASDYTLLELKWLDAYKQKPGQREAKGLIELLASGYELDDIGDCIAIAKENAERSPIGYIKRTLDDWKTYGKPETHKPTPQMMGYTKTERAEALKKAIVNLDEDD